MRSAMNRSRSGLIIRSPVETRNHDGSVLHAGGPARSVKLPPAMGFCSRSASTCRVQAISSASEVSGSCTATTWWPRRCRKAITRLQLDPSTHAPCTSSTLAFGRPLPVPAGAASAAEARPEVCTAAKPANAAVPFNTARRVGVPVGSLLEALGSQAAESTHATLNRPKQAVNQALHKRGKQCTKGAFAHANEDGGGERRVVADIAKLGDAVRRSSAFGAVRWLPNRRWRAR